MAKNQELEAVATATLLVVDHIEQLAGIGEELRAPQHNDEALCSRAVVRLGRLGYDLADLRHGLAEDWIQKALACGYTDAIIWCDAQAASYSEVVLELGRQLYAAVVLQCVELPPEAAWGEPLQTVDESALRAVWTRMAVHLGSFSWRVPWRDVNLLRQRVVIEHDRAAAG